MNLFNEIMKNDMLPCIYTVCIAIDPEANKILK